MTIICHRLFFVYSTMARIKFTALVSEIAGSIGGSTIQRNAYGHTIKNKPNMVNASKTLQNFRKISFASNAQKWRTLSVAQRNIWTALALSQPVPSRLNPDSNLNGFNYFSRYHNYLNVYDPTATLTNPTGVFGSLSDYANTITLIGGVLTWEPTWTLTGTNWVGLLYVTKSMGAGQEFVHDTPIFIADLTGSIGSSTIITTAFIQKFGQLPSTDDYLGTKVVFVNTVSGQAIIVPIEKVLIES